MARREFLFAAGSTIVALTLPGSDAVATVQARVAAYPRKQLGRWSDLEVGKPVLFRYPWDHPHCTNALIKLGRPAGGGVGPDEDIVAFNTICPHMGQILPRSVFQADPGVAGPCPLHWTTFDLTRFGAVVSGHATQGLPQIVLEPDGDHLDAVAVRGLIHGFHDNRLDPATIQ